MCNDTNWYNTSATSHLDRNAWSSSLHCFSTLEVISSITSLSNKFTMSFTILGVYSYIWASCMRLLLLLINSITSQLRYLTLLAIEFKYFRRVSSHFTINSWRQWKVTFSSLNYDETAWFDQRQVSGLLQSRLLYPGDLWWISKSKHCRKFSDLLNYYQVHENIYDVIKTCFEFFPVIV